MAKKEPKKTENKETGTQTNTPAASKSARGKKAAATTQNSGAEASAATIGKSKKPSTNAAGSKKKGIAAKSGLEAGQTAHVTASAEGHGVTVKPGRGKKKASTKEKSTATSSSESKAKTGRKRKAAEPGLAGSSGQDFTGTGSSSQPQNNSTADVQVIEGLAVYHDFSLLTDFDIYLFKEGKHFSLYKKLGSHQAEHHGHRGTFFAVWAPNAETVTVMGDFNGWNRESHQLKVREDESGIWEGFVPGVQPGMLYKYHIRSRYNMYHVEKSDPFSFARESPPQTASVVCNLEHHWQDENWMQERRQKAQQPQPYSVYEMHLGSWRRKPEDHNRPLTYRELAGELPQYLKDMGFTHLELLPIMYHPFNGSWGYQITGYFAVASQFGSPHDLMYLIDTLHQHGIGVILDWVPSHFPSDEHGLVYLDGTHLYEHADPRKGFHPDWNSYIFNYGRNEVRSFLISNALFWLDKYHVDGLRVDAVASMLYLDYSRKHDEWIPNEHGGRENLEAISFLKDFNQAVREQFPDVKTIAEESTAWPAVTGPVEQGGLGFDQKWMMGWMHDTLTYFARDPIYRQHHQGEITFSIIYAFSERFMLPLSHDEVVHGKGSLIRKMPGDEWQRFANLRLLYTYMYAHPGKKLLFMGAELAQDREWNHDSSLCWHLLHYEPHAAVQQLVRELNQVYRNEPALYVNDFEPRGFEWIDYNDAHNSVISFLRRGDHDREAVLVVCNFTPSVHHHYRLGVPNSGPWQLIFNSDETRFGGSGFPVEQTLISTEGVYHGREFSVDVKIPPLAVMMYRFIGA